MWPHAKRGTRFYGDTDQRSPSKIEGETFDINDGVIKLWLPEKLLAGVDVLSCEHGISRPDTLRWILFEHAYGRVELMHLQRRSRQEPSDVRFSIRRKRVGAKARAIRVKYLGKSNSDLKLELPLALKTVLENLSATTGEPVSVYIRRVLARDLLPEADYLDWQEAEASEAVNEQSQ